MNIILDGRQDGVRDNSPEKRDFKVVRNIIPEDIYDSRPDHRMFGWFLYFMHPAFGTEVLPGSKTGLTPGGVYIQRLVELATGHGAKPLTYLRETVWALIRDGKILKGGDLSLLPRDRVRKTMTITTRTTSVYRPLGVLDLSRSAKREPPAQHQA